MNVTGELRQITVPESSSTEYGLPRWRMRSATAAGSAGECSSRGLALIDIFMVFLRVHAMTYAMASMRRNATQNSCMDDISHDSPRLDGPDRGPILAASMVKDAPYVVPVRELPVHRTFEVPTATVSDWLK